MEEPDIWTANCYTSAAASDRGKTRIPTLQYTAEEQEVIARSNGEKGKVLTKVFFLPKLQGDRIQPGLKYLYQCKGNIKITVEQIQKQMKRLKPFKAPGPDSIPNIVLTKCTDMLTSRLFCIYEAMFEHSLLYKPWKSFTTVVLCKPGKLKYNMPKVYRPIALLNTMWKVVIGIVTEQLTYLVEEFQLLLAMYFGGRPRCTTSDAMHLLMNKIKTSWRAGKVTSVLFLDIEGAFPNVLCS